MSPSKPADISMAAPADPTVSVIVATVVALIVVLLLSDVLEAPKTSPPRPGPSALSGRPDSPTSSESADSNDPADLAAGPPEGGAKDTAGARRGTGSAPGSEAGANAGSGAETAGGEPSARPGGPTSDSGGQPGGDPRVRGPSEGAYVTVLAFDGRGQGRSAAFDLRGTDTRLIVNSSATSLAVHLVDDAQGRDAVAGYAEIDCAGPCREEHVVVAPAGRYRLEVDSEGGGWSVSIDEARPSGR